MSKGLYHNMNKRKKAGTSRSKKNSTVDPNVYNDPFALIGTAIKAKNTYENAKQLNKAGVKQEVENAANKALGQGTEAVITSSGRKNNNAVLVAPSNVSGQQAGQLQTATNTSTTNSNQQNTI